MNKLLLFFLSSMVWQMAQAQNVGINTTGATPAASAMLDIAAANKGLLIPRVVLTGTNSAGPVTSPAISLLVFNTATAGIVPNNVIPGYYYWNGVAWIAFTNSSPASTAWALGGNTGIALTSFVGTGDDKALVFKSNNLSFLEFASRGTLGLTQAFADYDDAAEKVTYVRSALQFEAASASFYKPKMWTDINGNFRVKGSSAGTDYFEFGSTGATNSGGFEFVIGDDGDEPIIFKSYNFTTGMSEIMRLQNGRMSVGSNAFDATNPEKLLIDAGATSSYNLMTGKGSIDNYLQINVKNSSTGGSASSDVVASANNGSETVNFIDMGVNSSGYSNTSLPVLAGANTTYLYSTGNDFVIGNATAAKPIRFFTGGTANTNERMRINGAGMIGIANLAPSQALDVTGNFRLSGAFMPNNLAGTAGTILQSNGAGIAATWVTPGSIASATSWTLGGNAVAANQNLGTTANFPLPFITNNTEKMRLLPTGGLAIGATTLDATNPEKLLINAGTTTSYNLIGAKGSIDSYLQVNVQNQSTGAAASADIVATANNGSETVNFIDLGINSSGYSSTGVLGGANNAYLYSTGNDFVIGNATAARNLLFFTGGSAIANERMRINGTGLVGIGNNAPSERLDVTGNFKLSGAFMPNNLAGTAGTILQSNGAGIAATWVTPGSIASATSWTLGGNAVAANQNLGTTANFPLPFITNNTEKMRLLPTGGLAIGATTLDATNPEKLLINAGTTTSYNLIGAKGSIDSYLQVNVQNQSTGAAASADIVATANNGSETVNFIDLGINSSGYSSTGVLGGANNAYLYSTGNDFVIGNATAARNLLFFTGGSAIANERMRINGTGLVGIGNNAPSERLDVTGNFKLSGAFMPNNLAGTAGTILQSNGAGIAATWVTPGSIASATSWTLGGNAVAANQNLGTTANFPLPFITNNTEKMRLLPTGGLAIGATTLDATNPEKLLINAGTTTSYNLIGAKGSIDSYLQVNVQNQSTGAAASADIVATANNGSETVNFIDLGINSSGYSSTGVLGGANNAYLYSTGNDFVIGNATAARNLLFFTGGSAIANERMRINGTGLVGIGNNAPSERLDVTGNFKLSGAFMPNNLAGTAGTILQSNGAGIAATWVTPGSIASATSWTLGGNAVAANQNLGTTANFPLPFITNNTEKMRLLPTGGLAIGATTLDATNPEKLLINAGTTTSYNLIGAKGSINSYLQVNVQNQSTGAAASSDIIATANNGSETVNFIDLGINSSGYSSTGVLGGANNAYLYSTGNDFVIGNATVAKNLAFFTGGTASTNERMRIDGNGNVGIGTSTVANSTLSINGSLTVAVKLNPGTYTLLATDHVIINTGIAVTWTIPAASSCTGRIYRLINQGTGSVTLSQNVTTANAVTSTVLLAASNYEIISDGTVWRKIN